MEHPTIRRGKPPRPPTHECGSLAFHVPSQSARISSSPCCTSGLYVVDHASAGTIALSPRFSGLSCLLNNVAMAIRLAELPLFVMTACFILWYAENSDSKATTSAPMVY